MNENETTTTAFDPGDVIHRMIVHRRSELLAERRRILTDMKPSDSIGQTCRRLLDGLRELALLRQIEKYEMPALAKEIEAIRHTPIELTS